MRKLKGTEKLAWDDMSRYIRLRDSIKTTGTKTRLQCVTCGKIVESFAIDGSQAGHCFSRQYKSTMFEETNVHGQCIRCNKFRDGEKPIHQHQIKNFYGEKEFNRLDALVMDEHANPAKYKRRAYDYIELRKKFRAKIKELL